MYIPFFRRKTVSFKQLQQRMMNLPAAHREEGKPPDWMREVTDWALNEAIYTHTFSSPWEKGMLLAEKERRDTWRNALNPAWISALTGALAGGIASWFVK